MLKNIIRVIVWILGVVFIGITNFIIDQSSLIQGRTVVIIMAVELIPLLIIATVLVNKNNTNKLLSGENQELRLKLLKTEEEFNELKNPVNDNTDKFSRGDIVMPKIENVYDSSKIFTVNDVKNNCIICTGKDMNKYEYTPEELWTAEETDMKRQDMEENSRRIWERLAALNQPKNDLEIW